MKCNKNFAELWGYRVCNNGEIFGLYGKKIKLTNVVRVKKDGKFVSFSPLRFIYYAFHQDTFDIHNYNYVVVPKNHNKKDRRLNNLEVVLKKDLVQGANNGYAKLNDKQVEEIIDIYQHNKGTISYRQLADEYGVSHTLIYGLVTGKFRNKSNYKLK